MPVIEAWQADNQATAVHEATAGFTGDVSRTLVVAPTIAMMADGNQKIARKYMLAAGIPDSTGDPNWPDTSPDMLDPDELAGPTEDTTATGRCSTRTATRCTASSCRCTGRSKDAEQNPEVVAEMRRVPQPPDPPVRGVSGGQRVREPRPARVLPDEQGVRDRRHAEHLRLSASRTRRSRRSTGQFLGVGGSEPAYTLPPGESTRRTDIVMITEKGTPVGVNDVWMTGFLDGVCPADETGCLGGQGQLPRRARVRRRPADVQEPDLAGGAAVPQLAVRGAVRDARRGCR
jgi:hypothetical protein